MPKGRGGEEKEMKGPNLGKYNFLKKFTKSPKVMTFDEKAAALKAGKTPYKGQIGGVTGFTGGETKAAESTDFKELLRTDSALQKDANDLQERIAEREAAIQRANALKVEDPLIITDIKIPPLSQAPERPLQRGNRPGR